MCQVSESCNLRCWQAVTMQNSAFHDQCLCDTLWQFQQTSWSTWSLLIWTFQRSASFNNNKKRPALFNTSEKEGGGEEKRNNTKLATSLLSSSCAKLFELLTVPINPTKKADKNSGYIVHSPLVCGCVCVCARARMWNQTFTSNGYCISMQPLTNRKPVLIEGPNRVSP